MADRDDSLEPSPAQMGETMTVDPDEWTPLDDIGTQLYVYGDQPVDVAVQRAEVDDEIRRLGYELERARSVLERVKALTKDADGNDLDGCEIVVAGKVRRALDGLTS